jgi:Xaa-Pro aminopeptidase
MDGSNGTLPRLVNLERAREVMERRGLDGLVAQLSINVYYLSGYWGMLMSAERFDAAFFAVLPRSVDAPATLVLPSMELRRLAAQGGTWMHEVVAYTSPLDDEAGAGVPYQGWPVRTGADLEECERRWVDVTAAHRDRVAGDAPTAMARAVRNAGLERGRLGTDDVRLATWLQGAGLDGVACTADPNLFNDIRRVKTPAELHLLRRAAIINETALRAAGAALCEGAEWSEMEREYFVSMADQGAQGSYFICGAGGLPSGRVRRGEPMMLDALGTYAHYHGDFGRCAVVGEPSDEMLRRHRALLAGWEAVAERLRPGARYSEIAVAAVEAIRKGGLPEFVYATPHGVGLEHTDDPKPAGRLPGAQWDTVLEPGMVLNVDLPFTEIGWGSVHVEDTVHITRDGFEPLTSQEMGIIRA